METVNYFSVQYLAEGPISTGAIRNDNKQKATLDEAYRYFRAWKHISRVQVEAMSFEERRERARILGIMRQVERDAGVTF